MAALAQRLRSHLTYANVMATIAVFIALGGVSYAAVNLPKNSVGTTQLKNNSVTLKKIAPSARESLASKGQQGPAGAPGAAGSGGRDGVIAVRQYVDSDNLGESGAAEQLDLISESIAPGSYIAIAKFDVVNLDASVARDVECVVYTDGFYADNDAALIPQSGRKTFTLTGGLEVETGETVKASCSTNASPATNGVSVTVRLTLIPADSITYEGSI